MIELDYDVYSSPKVTIKVIGVGSAGGNTVNAIISKGATDIEFLAANTDAQALERSHAHRTIQLGTKVTRGMGAGANPLHGKQAAQETLDELISWVGHTDMVFLTGGMGGGTGSGAMPIIAQALKEKGILTVAIVTKPFTFEGKRRTVIAHQALLELQDTVDTLIVIPNQRLLDLVGARVSMINAFSLINDHLANSITGIYDIITKPGYINVDFADLRTIMHNSGMAIMGTGRAKGDDRAVTAARAAICSPLLEDMNVAGARGVLLNIAGGVDMGIHEISAAASLIQEQVQAVNGHDEMNVIIGSVVDESLDEELVVTVIATGFSYTQTETGHPSVAHTSHVESDHYTISPKPAAQVKDSSEVEYTKDFDIPAFMRLTPAIKQPFEKQ